MNLSGRSLFSTEALAKDGGFVGKSEDSLKENTKKLSTDMIATYMNRIVVSKNIFLLRWSM